MESDNHSDSVSNPSPQVLCTKGCGYFGSPSTMNMCSKCFREHQKPQRQMSSRSSTPTPPSSGASSIRSARAPVAPAGAPRSDSKTAADLLAEKAGGQPKRKIQKNKGRCFSCRKKVGLTGFKCKCGYIYCGEHRYSDKHNCDFDYLSNAREQLAKANPVIVAAKLEKI